MGRHEIDLISPLPLDECRRRLSANIATRWLTPSDKPLIGTLSDTTLRVRKKIAYRNSFQTFLFARLTAQGRHTALRCRFSMHPFVLIFMIVWFSGLLVGVGGANLILSLANLKAGRPMLDPGALIPLLMMIFGIGLVVAGRTLARDERQFLIDLLCRLLEAQPARKEGGGRM